MKQTKILIWIIGIIVLCSSFSLGALTDGLVLSTHLSNTSLISDVGVNGLLTNGGTVTAVYGNGTNFTDSKSGYANWTTEDLLMGNTNPTAWAFSAWIKTSTVGNYDPLDTYDQAGAGGDNNFIIEIYTLSEHTICSIRKSGTSYAVTSLNHIASDGLFHNIICNINKTTSNLSMYVDGVYQGYTSIDGSADYSDNGMLYSGAVKYGGAMAAFSTLTIDEINVWNRSLSSSEIAQLSNSSTTTYYYPFTLPITNTTSLIYPTNTTHYTNDNTLFSDNFNGSIIVTSTLNVSCNLNDTRFTKLSSTLNTTHVWLNSTLANGNYSLKTNCTAPNQEFWFVIDTTHPLITQSNPSQINTTVLNYSIGTPYLKLNISTYDTYLYQANLSLYNATGHLVYSNYSGLITSLNYTYNWTQNLSNLSPSRYFLTVESSDSHTDKVIDSFKPNMDLASKKIDYKSPIEWGNIDFSIELISSSLKLDKLSDTKKTDRHSPEFSFETNEEKENQLQSYVFRIHASKPLNYIPNSEYIGHFVATDGMKGIWYDSMFDGYEGSAFQITQQDAYTYNIEIITKKQDLKFNSLGGLNYNSVNSTFEVQKNLTVYLKDAVYNNYLSDFSISINGSTQSTLTNSTTFFLNANNSYTISVTKFGTNNPVYTYITNFSINENAVLLINTTSLQVSIYDEFTGALVTGNVTGVLFSSVLYNSSTFTGGKQNYTNLSSGVYTYRAISSGYGLRSNTVTLIDGALTNLSVYLQNSTNLLTFTIRENVNPNNVIENATMKIYKYIGSTYTLIATEVSDVTGRIGLYYVSGDRYYFIVSKTNYLNKTFDFMPIFSEYSIYLFSSITPNIDYSAYSQMSIQYQPYTYKNGVVNNFSISFYNSANSLTFYGFNATYPHGQTSNSSTTATGGTLTGNFNITGATVFDTVNITFYYIVTGGTLKYQSFTFPIQLAPVVGTWVYVNPSNSDFGLAVGDRVLLFTLLIVVFAGIATFYGGVITGTVVGLFMMCFFAYVGLVPVWFIYTSVFIGFIILIWRGSA